MTSVLHSFSPPRLRNVFQNLLSYLPAGCREPGRTTPQQKPPMYPVLFAGFINIFWQTASDALTAINKKGGDSNGLSPFAAAFGMATPPSPGRPPPPPSEAADTSRNPFASWRTRKDTPTWSRRARISGLRRRLTLRRARRLRTGPSATPLAATLAAAAAATSGAAASAVGPAAPAAPSAGFRHCPT